MSLKQTAHLRSQSSVNSHEVAAYLRNNTSSTKEPTSLNSSTSSRSNLENGGGYIPYSPYGFRRRDLISRPTGCNSLQRSYSPGYRQDNGYKPDERSYSPYRTGGGEAEATRPYSPYRERWQSSTGPRSLSPFARDYSPWRRENVDPPVIQLPTTAAATTASSGNSTDRYSSVVKQRLEQIITVPQAHVQVQNIYASPMLSRKRFPSEPPPQGSHSSTSPQLLISRFAHQLKQEPPSTVPQVQLNSKESAKKRFASYVRLRLGSDREPSPEPPPRFNRGESPLLLRRNVGDQASPFFPRRYVSPSPPVPPPRRLSESSSVPGSPQHLYSRLTHYTPEPQRRAPPP